MPTFHERDVLRRAQIRARMCRSNPSVQCTGLVVAVFATLLLVRSGGQREKNFADRQESKSASLPPLETIEAIMTSTARDAFAGHTATYAAEADWHTERLRLAGENTKAPYIACAEYGTGPGTTTSLQDRFSPAGVLPIANDKRHGSCFLLTATSRDAARFMAEPYDFGLETVGPLIPTLKVSPGLLDHLQQSQSEEDEVLGTKHGEAMKTGNVRGLSVKLAPGVLQRSNVSTWFFIRDWQPELLTRASDLHAISFWSDPDVLADGFGHLGTTFPEGGTLVREWTRAADVLTGLSAQRGKTPTQFCRLERASITVVDDDFVVIQGIDHLLYNSKSSQEQVACFMELVGHLASKPEVLRISPFHRVKFANAVASAVVQSATTTEQPLHKAGLIGSGEVIQVVDTGLDETSCYFSDDDGDEVEHGYLLSGLLLSADGNLSVAGGDSSFPYDMARRKVVQYIELFKVADEEGDQTPKSADSSFLYASDYLGDPYEDDGGTFASNNPYATTSETYTEGFCAEFFADLSYSLSYYLDDSSPTSSGTTTISYGYGYDTDTIGGHGTWCSGIAAGDLSSRCSQLSQDCADDEVPGCVGKCVKTSTVNERISDDTFDLDLFCPMHDCDGYGSDYSYCLGDDPAETLRAHGGVAPGAKLAMLDVSYSEEDFLANDIDVVFLVGNDLWRAASGTGATIHSNSWGYETHCQHTEFEFLYDTYAHENPETLLIFAAGNGGGYKDIPSRESCTILTPALAKNILSVGATSSGPTREPYTGADGRIRYEIAGLSDYTPEGYPWICLLPNAGLPSTSAAAADIDTVAAFSSYGPTADGRIKPDVVAPGDQVFSASSDSGDSASCNLVNGPGTSAACPAVTGSAALVRQYFKDESFYARDVAKRGLCDTSNFFVCGSFAPSAVTVKAMLINSANLMGGSTEPDNYRGFGRVHLEAGMPMWGKGDLALVVADSSSTSIGTFEVQEMQVTINGDASEELRITLCWSDPPTTPLSSQHLQHDLDLVVTAPSGENYTMWDSGEADTANVVERVIVPESFIEDGAWTIYVSAGSLLTDHQPYSLVVTGAIVV